MNKGPGKSLLQQKLTEWYDENKRNLPWRSTKDPYRIWVSEIILQQTRVAQGMPYYERFVSAFPTVAALAGATEQEVLRLWQGLGYYSRARNMHRCAKKVAHELTGKFPAAYDKLLLLPGIGPYTAAAIASMAFQQPVAVVDGNVFRVLARLFGIEVDIASVEGKKMFTQKANELVAREHPGDFNQALMEFGATLCTPRNPDCKQCPFQRSCVAKNSNLIELLPVKSRKMKARVRYFTYFVFEQGAKLAMRKRMGRDIWNGLYDFYLVETARATRARRILEEDHYLKSLAKSVKISESPSVKHILSHQELRIKFVRAALTPTAKAPDGMKFYTTKQVQSLPKPIVINRFLEKSDF